MFGILEIAVVTGFKISNFINSHLFRQFYHNYFQASYTFWLLAGIKIENQNGFKVSVDFLNFVSH